MSDSKKLCPFKKDFERTIEKRSGKVTMRERVAKMNSAPRNRKPLIFGKNFQNAP